MVVHGSASQMNKKILHIAELAAVVRKTAFILGNWPILLSVLVLVFNSTSVSASVCYMYAMVALADILVQQNQSQI